MRSGEETQKFPFLSRRFRWRGEPCTQASPAASSSSSSSHLLLLRRKKTFDFRVMLLPPFSGYGKGDKARGEEREVFEAPTTKHEPSFLPPPPPSYAEEFLRSLSPDMLLPLLRAAGRGEISPVPFFPSPSSSSSSSSSSVSGRGREGRAPSTPFVPFCTIGKVEKEVEEEEAGRGGPPLATSLPPSPAY